MLQTNESQTLLLMLHCPDCLQLAQQQKQSSSWGFGALGLWACTWASIPRPHIVLCQRVVKLRQAPILGRVDVRKHSGLIALTESCNCLAALDSHKLHGQAAINRTCTHSSFAPLQANVFLRSRTTHLLCLWVTQTGVTGTSAPRYRKHVSGTD